MLWCILFQFLVALQFHVVNAAQSFTLQQVQAQQLTVVDDKVYDLKNFAIFHFGGAGRITSQFGKDASASFHSTQANHGIFESSVLSLYQVGTLGTGNGIEAMGKGMIQDTNSNISTNSSHQSYILENWLPVISLFFMMSFLYW
jgi:cytochrome b involved in lipid metabolism